MAASWLNKLNQTRCTLFAKQILVKLSATKNATYTIALGVVFSHHSSAFSSEGASPKVSKLPTMGWSACSSFTSILDLFFFEPKVDHISPPCKLQKCLDVFSDGFQEFKTASTICFIQKGYLSWDVTVTKNTLLKWTTLATHVKWRMGQHDI